MHWVEALGPMFEHVYVYTAAPPDWVNLIYEGQGWDLEAAKVLEPKKVMDMVRSCMGDARHRAVCDLRKVFAGSLKLPGRVKFPALPLGTKSTETTTWMHQVDMHGAPVLDKAEQFLPFCGHACSQVFAVGVTLSTLAFSTMVVSCT